MTRAARTDNAIRLSVWPTAAIPVLALAALVTPAIVYQVRHFMLGWHDVGTYVRELWNLFDHGRFALYSNGTGDFFVDQHFEPFLLVLAGPVRLGGTIAYVALITAAMACSAGYVYALACAVGQSRRIGALCAAAYVANPYTYSIALSYHVETFAVLFLTAFACYAYTRRAGLAWLALLLALTVKEDMWLYAAAAAVIVHQRGQRMRTAAFVAAALFYYVVAIQLVGGWLYPTANYLSAFYKVHDRPMAKMEVAGMLLGRWREFLWLLFTGPGRWFQVSMLFLGVFSGWRYILVCGVLLIWLSYPDGPPRSTLEYYYAYAPLALAFIAWPFGLVNLQRWIGRALTGAPGARTARWAPAVATAAVLVTDVVLHLPGHVPPPLDATVNPRVVYGPGYGVNVAVVRPLIARYLRADAGGVMAQFYTIPMIPQRHALYVTFADRTRFLEGRLRPMFVLLDLNGRDPSVTSDELLGMVQVLRSGGHYVPIFDDQGVLLYRRREP